MASYYDTIDVAWAWNGDLLIGDSGDLRDTGNDTLQSLIDQVSITCKSALRDWYIYPGRGAGLDDFIGEPNTRLTGEKIHDRVRVALVSSGIVAEEDLTIRVFPVHLHKVLIIIKIDAIAQPTNRLGQGETVQVALVFDTIEQNVFFIDKSTNIGS